MGGIPFYFASFSIKESKAKAFFRLVILAIVRHSEFVLSFSLQYIL